MIESKKNTYYKVDSRLIDIVEGFNVRTDFSDVEELAESIRENGVKGLLRVYRNGDRFNLIDGERRLRGCRLLNESGINLLVPVIIEDQKASEESRVLDMLIFNDGKKLNPLEESEAISRLMNYGMSASDISKKTGKSVVYINNLKLLSGSPSEMKNWIRDETIKSTLAIQILKEEGSFEKATETLRTAIQEKGVETKEEKKEGKILEKVIESEEEKGKESDPVKVTMKDIKKSKKEFNSITAFKNLRKLVEGEGFKVKKEKGELYEFCCKLIDGKLSNENIFEILVEYESVEE